MNCDNAAISDHEFKVHFWRYLAKDRVKSLPLKQRSPEVALFKGSTLLESYCSDVRGLYRQRTAAETTREMVLDRFLAIAARHGHGSLELNRSTPAAILRREGQGGSGQQHGRLMLVVELMELLERFTFTAECGRRTYPADVGPDECWSLQGLVHVAEDLRMVATYTRDAQGEEHIKVESCSYSDVYPHISQPAECPQPLPRTRQKPSAERRLLVERKTLALVRYAHFYHDKILTKMAIEFVLDVEGRAVLHGVCFAEMANSTRQQMEETTRVVDAAPTMQPQPQPVVYGPIPPSQPLEQLNHAPVDFGAKVLPAGDVEDCPEPAIDTNVNPNPSLERAKAALRDPPSPVGTPFYSVAAQTLLPTCEEEAESARAAREARFQAAAVTGVVAPLGIRRKRQRPHSAKARLVHAQPSTDTFPSVSEQSGSFITKPRSRPTSARASRAATAARQTRPKNTKVKNDRSNSPSRSRSAGELPRHRPCSVPPRPNIQNRQLFSRYEKESDTKPRLLCALARQLERYREHLQAWALQQKALMEVMANKEMQVVEVSGEVEKLLLEREQLDKAYSQKYDALVRGLHREQERATDAAQAKKRELDKSLELERETTQILGEEEGKNRALRCTLDRTVDQLNAVRTEMLQCQAAAEARGLQFTEGSKPRLRLTQAKIEASIQEKEKLRQETKATAEELAPLHSQLQQQRAYTMRLEEFLRKIALGPQSRHLLDPAMRKEAMKLLAFADRRHRQSGTDDDAEAVVDAVVMSADGVRNPLYIPGGTLAHQEQVCVSD